MNKRKLIGIAVAAILLLSAIVICLVLDPLGIFGEKEGEETTVTETSASTAAVETTENSSVSETEPKEITSEATPTETETEVMTETEPPVIIEGIKPADTVTDTSFFESVFFALDVEKEEYINAAYNKLPRVQQKQRMPALLSRNTAFYKNAEGKKILADAYYCAEGEEYGTNEAAVGLLLYNSIIYKIENPKASVSISFTSSDIDIETAVCVVYQSRYFGYVRDIEGEGNEYDGNGFIRISYMLVEAAKMGIDVNIASLTGEKDDFTLYIGRGLESKCYSKYAKGKSVSDYLTLETVKWSEDGAGDAISLTALTVSAYTDRFKDKYIDGAVFISGGGLSGVDENGKRVESCSGVTVTGHKEIYNVTKNFIGLLAEYSDEDEFDAFKKVLNERNAAQTDMFARGKQASIPEKERIIWLGDENDGVFKLCFSIGEGKAYSLYESEIAALASFAEKYPDESRVLLLNTSTYKDGSALLSKVSDAVGSAFADGKNSENRLSLTVKGYKNQKLSSLTSEEIGYVSHSDKGSGSDELLLSYLTEDGRVYVTLLSSPLMEDGDESRVDMLLSISESEALGDSFFMAIGNESDGECIKEEGLTFSCDEIIYQTDILSTVPQTFEAVFEVNEAAAAKNAYCGMLMSNFDNWYSQVSYDIVSSGAPRVTVWITEFASDPTRPAGDHYKMTKLYFKFDQVDVRSYSEVHLAIVHDRENQMMHCYVNGELKQSLHQNDVLTEEQLLEGVPPLYDYKLSTHFVIGGSLSGSNGQHFRGVIKEIAVWSDVRSAAEIAADVSNDPSAEDSALLAAYNFRGDREEGMKDLSANGNDLICDKLWQDVDEVEEVEDFAYSFALIGDIQVLSERYFNDHYIADKTEPNDPYDDVYVDGDLNSRDNEIEYIDRIFSWLLANKDEHKIEYVMTLGDLTQQSWTAEWDYVKSQLYRLEGKIPFSIVAGNHDRRDPDIKEMTEYGYYIWPEERLLNAYFHTVFNDDIYRAQIDGSMTPADVANTYNAFEVGNTKYLLITLDYGASDAVLEWASGIVESYPDHKVIINTHAYLFRDGTTVDAYDTYPATRVDGGANDGDDMWEKFISKHENIVLVFSGHDPYDHIVYTKSVGENGNTVTEFLIDPQGMDAYMPVCTGMIAMIYFSEDGNTITVRYYSPVYNRFGSEKSQFTITIGE